MAAKQQQSLNADGKNEAVQAWKNKTEQTKKINLVKDIHKLTLQIQALEREKGTHIYSKRNDFRKEFSQLEEMESKLVTERKTELSKSRQQLQKINNSVRRFRREIKDVRPTPEFVEKLKVIMEDIEGTINSFKEQHRQRYEELLRDERITTQEVQALEKKFEGWTHSNDSGTWAVKSARTKPLTSARDITKDLPTEVAAFEKFLQQTGGMKGGWDEYDHNTFLKFRNRSQNKRGFMDQLVPALPTRTQQEISDHESWYKEYLRLNEEKKEAIQRWREKKEEEKEIMSARLEDVQSCLSDEEDKSVQTKDRVLQEKEEKEIMSARLEDVQSCLSDEEDKSVQTKDRFLQEKVERFSKLNAWKVQKELERAQEEERRLREKLTVAKKGEEERKKKIEIRAKVQQFKKQREEEEAFFREQDEMREHEETERKRQLSAREITKFRQRDFERLDEKLKKEKMKEEKERLKQKQLEKIKETVEVVRDPSRLYQPTAGWKERLKDTGPSGGGPVLTMPHRAIPSWRQGVN